MNLIQQYGYPVRLIQTIAISIGLAALPNTAKSGQRNVTAAAPIVSLQFDDTRGVLWKATPRTLARSLNEGRTWRPMRLPASAQGNIASLTISAGSTKTIYVAVVGSGVLRSRMVGALGWRATRGCPMATLSRLPRIQPGLVRCMPTLPEKEFFAARTPAERGNFLIVPPMNHYCNSYILICQVKLEPGGYSQQLARAYAGPWIVSANGNAQARLHLASTPWPAILSGRHVSTLPRTTHFLSVRMAAITGSRCVRRWLRSLHLPARRPVGCTAQSTAR